MYTDIYMYPNGRNKCTGHAVTTPKRLKDMSRKEIQRYAQYIKDSYDFVGELVFAGLGEDHKIVISYVVPFSGRIKKRSELKEYYDERGNQL